ncbi:MAG: aminopeptidase P family protein [Firmicutes bacterium]|nr:aminopeptidase P family protein [Bacillota bacterium]
MSERAGCADALARWSEKWRITGINNRKVELAVLPIDFAKRRLTVAQKVEEAGLDAYIGTRMAALHYLGGAFMPWRGAVVVTAGGECRFVYWLGDAERVKAEGSSMKLDLYFLADMFAVLKNVLDELGLSAGKIGMDLLHAGNNALLAPGMLTAGEYLQMRETFPRATIENGVACLDEVMLIKDEAEIERMRAAALVGDYGWRCGYEAVQVGVTENYLAGVAEAALRRKGSFWSWSGTGGTEVGSGERTAYAYDVTRQASERKIGNNEFIILDVHPMVDLYMGDNSVPIFIGTPDDDQKRLIDCWEEAVETVFKAIKPGASIAEVAAQGMSVYSNHDLMEYAVPSFGHGLGVCARTEPNITPVSPGTFEEGMVIAMGAHLYRPGVGGMMLEYPVLIGKNGAEKLGELELKVHFTEG